MLIGGATETIGNPVLAWAGSTYLATISSALTASRTFTLPNVSANATIITDNTLLAALASPLLTPPAIGGTTPAAGTFTTLTANTSIITGASAIMSYVLTTTSTTAGQVIASIAQGTYRAVKFIIQGSNSASGYFQATEILAVSNSTNIDFTEYGNVQTGGATGAFSVIVSGSNLQLVVTPALATSTTFKVTAILMTV